MSIDSSPESFKRNNFLKFYKKEKLPVTSGAHASNLKQYFPTAGSLLLEKQDMNQEEWYRK